MQRILILLWRYICYNNYSDNYSVTQESFWNYYRDEINDSAIENNEDGNKIKNNKTITSKSFEYKTKIMGRIPDDNNTSNTEVFVPLKYLSNFWIFFDVDCHGQKNE